MICFFFDSHVSLVCDYYLNRAVAYHGSRPIITQWHRPLWPVLDIMSRLLGDFRVFVCSQNPRGSRNLLTKSIKDYPSINYAQLSVSIVTGSLYCDKIIPQESSQKWWQIYYHLQKIFFLIREPQVWTGESLILITPEDILLAEERENNISSKQHERRLKLKKT